MFQECNGPSVALCLWCDISGKDRDDDDDALGLEFARKEVAELVITAISRQKRDQDDTYNEPERKGLQERMAKTAGRACR